jgi:hypothetical protein
MKVLTVYAHPNPRSFCHAILQGGSILDFDMLVPHIG